MRGLNVLLGLGLLASLLLGGCGSAAAPTGRPAEGRLRVLAAETFIADIAQNVAGDRVRVDALMALGADPHAFEPTPEDIARVANCQVLIVNGAGFEGWLEKTLANAGGKQQVIEAAAGLTSRAPREGEAAEMGEHYHTDDPHFWLDPSQVIHYVENIRAGLTAADPDGKDVYSRNAEAYTRELKDLDQWIAAQVEAVPPARRLIVTNHESLGYFADRYGFQIIGTVVPSFSSEASPSAQQLADLEKRIRATGVKAIFLETGSNPQLAQQVARDTGIKVVSDLYTHSISAPGGQAPSYVAMIRFNTQAIVEALK